MDVDDKTASATQTDVNKSKELLKKESKRAIKEIKDINDEKKKESDSELFNAKANVCDKNVFNTLHYAAQGNRNVLEIIYDQCKGMNHLDNKRKIHPLHILAYYGHRNALDFLLRNMSNNININHQSIGSSVADVRDYQGRTPLDYAAFQGESDCVKCLLSYSADCTNRDTVTGRTAVHAAAYRNQDECLKVIALCASSYSNCGKKNSSEKSSSNPDHFVDYDQETEVSNKFIASLANAKDNKGQTPLMLAVEQEHLNTISFLVKQMDADILIGDNRQRTCLHRAVKFKKKESKIYFCLLINVNLNKLRLHLVMRNVVYFY
jgi:ankyrin repeat protein